MNKYHKTLLEKGYRKHVHESYKLLHMTDTLYQKKITDSTGVRYFINIWWYPERTVGDMGHVMCESVQPEVQMTTRDGTHVSIEYLSCDTEKAEDYFDDVWVELGMDYYERY